MADAITKPVYLGEFGAIEPLFQTATSALGQRVTYCVQLPDGPFRVSKLIIRHPECKTWLDQFCEYLGEWPIVGEIEEQWQEVWRFVSPA